MSAGEPLSAVDFQPPQRMGGPIEDLTLEMRLQDLYRRLMQAEQDIRELREKLSSRINAA